jgi:hypothetical protein
MLADGMYTETVPDGSDEIVSAITAAGDDALLFPPRTWFQNPSLQGKTPIAVKADGRVYGHIAPWDATHTGMPYQRVPRSASNYAFFRTGVVVSKEGDEIPVGQVTLAGGHCNDLTASAGDAVKHYDDTSSAVADVNVGEDAHGIWIAGSIRPGVSAEQIRALRASAPSGDWRPINGSHELVAICQVNHPGFPVARTLVAGGQMQAIIAAGASAMYELRQQEAIAAAISDMDTRITKIEDKIAGTESTETAGETTKLESVVSSVGTISSMETPAGIVFNVHAASSRNE